MSRFYCAGEAKSRPEGESSYRTDALTNETRDAVRPDTGTVLTCSFRRQQAHPWIPKQIPVRGFVYDVKTGKLSEVK